MHIALAGIPLLEWDPPAMTSQLNAQHIMTHPVVVLRETETVRNIMFILENTDHNGFPVVRDESNGTETPTSNKNRKKTVEDQLQSMSITDTIVIDSLEEENFGLLKGLILRHQLITLLAKKCYLSNANYLKPDDFRESYPRYLSLKDVDIAESEMDYELDLRPYMYLSPYSLTENTNLPRIFRLFRGLGLRHLIIVDEHNRVVGIVTRIDIAKYRAHVTLRQTVIKELSVTL
jgi:chloride channel 7